MPRIAVLIPPELRRAIFDDDTLERLATMGEITLFPKEGQITSEVARSFLADAEICIGSWGMPRMDMGVLDAAPGLRLIAYAAGSVKAFVTDAVWERGIRVTSGSRAIAFSVAEFTVALAIMALRDGFRLAAGMRNGTGEGTNRRRAVRELWGSTVGIVSMGQVGRRVAERMRPFTDRLLGWDPHAPDDAFTSLGVQRTGLDDLLAASDVVTLHSPNLPETRHMIGAERLARMKDDAVFINTARGAIVDEAALIDELRKGRLFACLDVTDPEPPAPDSPLRSFPNVFLTPHIAGPRSRRLGLGAVEEVERFLSGRPQMAEITKDMLPFTA